MQCILREKLIALAATLTDVSEVYRTERFRFVDAYLAWLKQAENDLMSTRSPICILLQAESTSVASVLDGFRPEHLEVGRSLRKSQRAVAAQSLERVSREIYSSIERIDHQLNEMDEKLCHAVAVLASKNPDTYERLTPSQEGVDIIWSLLSMAPETIPIYNYFCAKLTLTDRNYLLLAIIQNVINNRIIVCGEAYASIH
jgi:hypothetical protein